MLLEQVYLFYIQILFSLLAIMTIISTGLYIALIAIIRKLDNIKNTSLPGR